MKKFEIIVPFSSMKNLVKDSTAWSLYTFAYIATFVILFAIDNSGFTKQQIFGILISLWAVPRLISYLTWERFCTKTEIDIPEDLQDILPKE